MNSAAKVGLFMVVILAVLGFFILKIEDIPLRRGAEARSIAVMFDSVAGLDEKSAVRVAGVRVGKVADIRLTSEGRALVTLQIDRDVVLHQGASAKVVELGLLGEKYIELDPGALSGSIIAEGESTVLSGSQAASIGDVTDQVSLIADDVKAITASMRTAMGGAEGERRLVEIVDNVREITERVRSLIAANEMNVGATAENLRAITADLRVEIPKIAASIDRVANSIGGTVTDNRDDVRVIVENLRDLSADLKKTNQNLDAITGQVRSGEGTVGKLIYSEEAHQRLNTALASVESGVDELRNSLGRVNRIDLDLGIRSDYYSGLEESDKAFAGNSRSSVFLDLTPDPDLNRFYRIELADDPRGRLDTTRVERTIILPDGTEQTTTIEDEQFDRDFLVSAQAGWRLDDWSLRVGLFDSTGGFGADYRVNDRIQVTGEAFDFGQRRFDDPYLRLYGQFILTQERPNFPLLFLTTGVDNPLNDTAFTIGGGIRWSDDDLKYLLGSIPLGR